MTSVRSQQRRTLGSASASAFTKQLYLPGQQHLGDKSASMADSVIAAAF